MTGPGLAQSRGVGAFAELVRAERGMNAMSEVRKFLSRLLRSDVRGAGGRNVAGVGGAGGGPGGVEGEPGRDWGWRRSGGGTSGLEVKRVGESGLEPRAGTGDVMGLWGRTGAWGDRAGAGAVAGGPVRKIPAGFLALKGSG